MTSHRSLAALACLFTLATAVAASAKSADKDAKVFIADAVQGDVSEIKLAELAGKNAGRDAVRQFAETLVQDHRQARQQAERVAEKLGVTPPDQPGKKFKKEIRQLTHVSGPSFDTEYIRFEIKTHKKTIKDFEKEAKGSGPAAELAKEQLPTLKKHLQTAQSLSLQSDAQ